MDLMAVKRYYGGRWTGEHQHTDQILRVMSHILPDTLFCQLAVAMIDRVPNLLKAELPSKEVASLLSMDNLQTAVKNSELVDKAI